MTVTKKRPLQRMRQVGTHSLTFVHMHTNVHVFIHILMLTYSYTLLIHDNHFIVFDPSISLYKS